MGATNAAIDAGVAHDAVSDGVDVGVTWISVGETTGVDDAAAAVAGGVVVTVAVDVTTAGVDVTVGGAAVTTDVMAVVASNACFGLNGLCAVCLDVSPDDVDTMLLDASGGAVGMDVAVVSSMAAVATSDGITSAMCVVSAAGVVDAPIR